MNALERGHIAMAGDIGPSRSGIARAAFVIAAAVNAAAALPELPSMRPGRGTLAGAIRPSRCTEQDSIKPTHHFIELTNYREAFPKLHATLRREVLGCTADLVQLEGEHGSHLALRLGRRTAEAEKWHGPIRHSRSKADGFVGAAARST